MDTRLFGVLAVGLLVIIVIGLQSGGALREIWKNVIKLIISA